MSGKGLYRALSDRSRANAYDVYTRFAWPDELPGDRYWMGPELLTVAGTEWAERLGEAGLMRLSHLETLNLFSIFTRGESELLQTVLQNCVREDLSDCFEYFSHFIDEENKHMWFFAEFCRRFRGKPYPVRILKGVSGFGPETELFLAFMRILVFEEMGDFMNVQVMKDARVPDLIREIHRTHHQDESGHIAMGWNLGARLWERAARESDEGLKVRIRAYLDGYAAWSVQNLYNPQVYADAGFAEPYKLRESLLEHPARKSWQDAVFRRMRNRLAVALEPASHNEEISI